jgi:hypothetical protein
MISESRNGKGKIVPVHFFLAEHHAMKTYSLASALYAGEWSASRPGRFTPRERAPDTQWIGGWVVPRAVPDAVVKRIVPSHRIKYADHFLYLKLYCTRLLIIRVCMGYSIYFTTPGLDDQGLIPGRVREGIFRHRFRTGCGSSSPI